MCLLAMWALVGRSAGTHVLVSTEGPLGGSLSSWYNIPWTSHPIRAEDGILLSTVRCVPLKDVVLWQGPVLH